MDGLKKGLTNLKKKFTTMSRDSEDFSDTFLAMKSTTKKSQALMEELGKQTREYATVGREFAQINRRLAQTLDDLAKALMENGAGGGGGAGEEEEEADWIRNSQAASHLVLFSAHRATIADTLSKMVDEVDKLLSGYVDQVSKEFQVTRTAKKKCYQAYEEREVLKAKVSLSIPSLDPSLSLTRARLHAHMLYAQLLSMANTKTEASIWLDAQQTYRASAVKFSQLEAEATVKMEECDRFKVIPFLLLPPVRSISSFLLGWATRQK